MFSAALMLWLIYHKTTSGDKHVMTCLSDAAGQRRRRCTRLVARGALRGGGSGGGGGRGAAGGGGARELVSAAEHVGEKFSQ